MSRAGASLWSSASGSTEPSAEHAVRITSIGCVLAGMHSSTPRTFAGMLRSDASLRL
jgi:hypothetical protein